MNMKHGHRVLVALLAGLLLVTAPVFAQSVTDPFGQPVVQVRSHPAYYVWVDQAGWHVRWATTFPQLFSGFVASDGEIRNVRRAGGSVSWLSRSGPQRAVFATVVFSGIDGFDFEATGWNVTFSLLTNTGATRPDWIFIGRNLAHPGGAVFTLVVNPLLVLQGGGREPLLSEIERPVDRDR